jgi:(4-(4-[2-(gamma-L-glutamylamino)ethyl]phenoxymethyl)furan-2-yl)methanamine synthase
LNYSLEEPSLVDAIGFDIGGANTKAAHITFEKNKLLRTQGAVEYFPMWKHPDKLAGVLLGLKEKFGVSRLDVVGVTMTAELSDAYQTKREGVNHILGCVKQAFPHIAIYVLSTDVKLEPFDLAKDVPLQFAAANWAATGWIVSHHLKNCVVVDVGSTSTSIIPIVNGKVSVYGRTDLEKLVCGELVYTGSLRTNVAAITDAIPTSKGVATVSSELFALSGDVHLALGHITEKEYSCETADGKGKSLTDAFARLARVVCGDTEMLTRQEILEIAKYIYDKQLFQIQNGLSKVYGYTKSLVSDKVPVVVTGLGKDFLAKEAAEKIGIDSIIDLTTLLPKDAVFCTPAYGVALMAAKIFEGASDK